MESEAQGGRRDRRTRRREGRRLGRRDSVHQPRPVEVTRPVTAEQAEVSAVGQGWSQAMAAGDVEATVQWYAPEAVVHLEGEVLLDREEIRRGWAQCPVLGVEPTSVALASTASTHADGFDVLVRWVGRGVEGADVESRLRIHDGVVVEQWHGEVRRFEPVVGTPLEVSTAGSFATGEREAVTAMMWRVLERVESEVRHAGVRVEHHRDPARPAHFSAKAYVELERHHLHARASAATFGALIDLLERRLRLQLEERADRRRALRRRGTASPPGEWRHGDRPPSHPRVPPRPDDERAVIVRSTWAGGPEHVDEAVEDLEALDLEVLLFEEEATGQPAVLWHGDDDRYHLRLASGEDPCTASNPPPVTEVTVESQPIPTMDVESARTELLLGEPWVAFRDVDTGRVGVLYRRIDGHDGLVILGSVSAV